MQTLRHFTQGTSSIHGVLGTNLRGQLYFLSVIHCCVTNHPELEEPAEKDSLLFLTLLQAGLGSCVVFLFHVVSAGAGVSKINVETARPELLLGGGGGCRSGGITLSPRTAFLTGPLGFLAARWAQGHWVCNRCWLQRSKGTSLLRRPGLRSLMTSFLPYSIRSSQKDCPRFRGGK